MYNTSIYDPNIDNPSMFHFGFTSLSAHSDKALIVWRDFNMEGNLGRLSMADTPHNWRSTDTLKQYLSNFGLSLGTHVTPSLEIYRLLPSWPVSTPRILILAPHIDLYHRWTDANIPAKILASRLEDGLSALIEADQIGKKHYSFIITIYIIYAPTNKVSEYITSLGAEAFNREEWHYLFAVLEKVGLWSDLISWMKSLYTSPSASIVNIQNHLIDLINSTLPLAIALLSCNFLSAFWGSQNQMYLFQLH